MQGMDTRKDLLCNTFYVEEREKGEGGGDEVEKESMNIRNILVYLYRPPRAVTKREKEKKN